VLRKRKIFPVKHESSLIRQALSWADQFSICCLLNNNNIAYPNQAFPLMLGAGAVSSISENAGSAFESLKKYYKSSNELLIGFFGYDLKNEIEQLSSNNTDKLGFPDLLFFRPAHLLFFENDQLVIESTDDPDLIFQQITSFQISEVTSINISPAIHERVSKEEYLQTLERIKSHLLEGDIYEMNYCMEFFAEQASINPIETYLKLNEISPMPFSSYLKFEDKYLICASPERFLKKENNRLLSQPIKGTRKRSPDPKEDARLKKELAESKKELAENMMIVDLVRNDLAKSSVPGTVKAEELFGIYSFAQVHQMISAISSEKRKGVHFIDTIKNAFPMGSMTGAPKISAMKLIEKYELSKRGLFSGALGYIDHNENFDFNVVIRSLLYNAESGYLSFQAGSAITYDSDPEQEYEECLLKAAAIRKALSDQ
jgi:para-aminobenzoate synthetase component I